MVSVGWATLLHRILITTTRPIKNSRIESSENSECSFDCGAFSNDSVVPVLFRGIGVGEDTIVCGRVGAIVGSGIGVMDGGAE